MGMFTAISSTAFQELQTDAGMLLKSFDPENPAAPDDEDIICATTGGVNVTCVPQYSDYGEDVDNVMNGSMELKHLDSWECGISTTGLGTSAAAIKLSLGAADVDGNKIVPRREVGRRPGRRRHGGREAYACSEFWRLLPSDHEKW